MHQVAQMDLIYLHACLTIVAGDGTDAHAGLSGFTTGSRQFHQNVVNLAGLRFASCTAPILKAFDDLKWHSRAWTYQEFMLSKRLLVFTQQQVYYNCSQQTYSEDFIMLNKPDAPWWDTRLQVNFKRAIWNSDRWHSYMSMVQEITGRDVTMHADIIRSVTGVLSSMSKHTGEDFVCGLPSSMLEVALMWQPLCPLRRRGVGYSGYPFPTWSWAGWEGKMRHAPEYSPFTVHPIIHEWRLHVSKSARRPRLNGTTNFLEWIVAEVLHDCIAYSRKAAKELPPNAGDYPRTTWAAPVLSPPNLNQLKSTGTGLLKSVLKDFINPSARGASSNPPGPPGPLPQFLIESAVLHFPGQTKSLLIDPKPTPFFHQGLQKPCTGVFRILNHVQQWVGTIHLALPPPFGAAIMPVPAEFVAIAVTSASFEDTNTVNPGPNVGQNSFDVDLWRPLVQREVRLLNVLWIRWVGDVAHRVGAGQVHTDAWAVGGVVNREIWLA